MCAHPHALCLGLGDGYHIRCGQIMLTSRYIYWTDRLPSIYAWTAYVLNVKLGCFSFLFCLSIVVPCPKNKKTALQDSLYSCVMYNSGWGLAGHGLCSIVAVEDKPSIQIWMYQSIGKTQVSGDQMEFSHTKGGEMYTKIYGREKWETGRKRLVGSYLESDELWLLEREWMTYRSLKMTLERQWDRHLGCEAFAFDNDRRVAERKQNNKKTKNGKMEDVSNDGTSDDGRNNDRQVACFNYHQSLYLRSLYCTTTIVGCSHNAQHSQVWMLAMLSRLCNRRLRVEHSKS